KTLSQQGTMKNSGTYQEYNVKDTIKEMGSLLNNLTLFISAIAAISLVIAGVGVMNMMYISVSERIKEIGIRRALGGTASDIKKQLLTEGIALT
ncbi:ABC transporter permease, partial [Streptococcus suis]